MDTGAKWIVVTAGQFVCMAGLHFMHFKLDKKDSADSVYDTAVGIAFELLFTPILKWMWQESTETYQDPGPEQTRPGQARPLSNLANGFLNHDHN